jgi:hypothetical protein
MVSKSNSAVWTLTPAEKRVQSGAVTGQPVNLKDGDLTDTSVRASWLIELIAGRTDDALHPKGLDLRGATVTGPVDWQARQVAYPLCFTGCTFDEDVVLNQARVVSLTLNDCVLHALQARQLQTRHDLSIDGSHLPGGLILSSAQVGGALTGRHAELGMPADQPGAVCLDGDDLHVRADVIFSEAVTHGEVRLSDAHIEGGLDFAGAQLHNRDGAALNAQRLNVQGAVVLYRGDGGAPFTADGQVSIVGACIGGPFYCTGGSFRHEGGAALTAAGTKIGGDAFLDEGVSVVGGVDLSGTEVGGQLNCVGGSFGNEHGAALVADDAKITGDAILGAGFTARGAVSLYDAMVSNLVCAGGEFKNPGGVALVADRITVRGNVRLDMLNADTTFAAEGEVRLAAAQVGGQLSCTGGSFRNQGGAALTLAGAKIGGEVVLAGRFAAAGIVDLSGTQVGAYLNCTGGSFGNEGGTALVADDAKIGGDAILGGGFSARGMVSLYDATVSNLFCASGEFKNPGGVALVAERITVRGNVRLDKLNADTTFTAEGEVRLAAAQVGGQLSCAGGSFSNQGGAALNATGAKVGSDAILGGGFSAAGSVDLSDTQIGGQLSCIGGSFANEGGTALDVAGAKISGGVFLANGFTANGTVNMSAAEFGGQLNCRNGSFRGPANAANKVALLAERITVKIAVLLDHLSAEGEVRFAAAQVGGQLSCTGSSLSNQGGAALTAADTTISGNLILSDGFAAAGVVDLSGTQVGGELNCAGGSFGNEGGTALMADDARVGGDAILGGGFSARGMVRLYDATVSNLFCAGGEFKNPHGIALAADRVTVRGDVRVDKLDGGTAFTAEGGVGFAAAQVGGQLSCTGGSFSNQGGVALSAAGAKVGGDAILGGGFSAAGGVDLSDTQIGGQLSCVGGNFANQGGTALAAAGGKIGGSAYFSSGFAAAGRVDLSSTQVGGQLNCTGGNFSNPGDTALAAAGTGSAVTPSSVAGSPPPGRSTCPARRSAAGCTASAAASVMRAARH